ncbi:MAG TPA: hypothetical protein VF077_09095 [Nitrospiraceae bacterium]
MQALMKPKISQELAIEPSWVDVVCWECSDSKPVRNYPRRTIADVRDHAMRAHKIVVEDVANGRLLIFCDPGCARSNRKFDGSYSRIPPDYVRTGEILHVAYLLYPMMED